MPLIILFVLVFIFVGPYFSIEALNALFGLDIKTSATTWCAMFWVHVVLTFRIST